MKDKRHMTVKESVVGACKEVKEMRSGRTPKPSWKDFRKEMEALIAKEKVTA